MALHFSINETISLFAELITANVAIGFSTDGVCTILLTATVFISISSINLGEAVVFRF